MTSACIFDALRRTARSRCRQAAASVTTFRRCGLRAIRLPRRVHVASGPVSFMRVWDAMCATLSFHRLPSRRHDGDPGDAITRTSSSSSAPNSDQAFALALQLLGAGDRRVHAGSDGRGRSLAAAVRRPRSTGRSTRATLWRRHHAESAWESSEPGVLFIDRINAGNNLAYREKLSATNPCGEAPLPPYGAVPARQLQPHGVSCTPPFTPAARLDLSGVWPSASPVAVRLLDNLLDVSAVTP
jgi:ribonucleoside-diphosphate reductase alpha chain